MLLRIFCFLLLLRFLFFVVEIFVFVVAENFLNDFRFVIFLDEHAETFYNNNNFVSLAMPLLHYAG